MNKPMQKETISRRIIACIASATLTLSMIPISAIAFASTTELPEADAPAEVQADTTQASDQNGTQPAGNTQGTDSGQKETPGTETGSTEGQGGTENVTGTSQEGADAFMLMNVEGDDENNEPSDKSEFDSLYEAIQAGQPYTLQNDLSVDGYLDFFGKDISLNLGGHTLSVGSLRVANGSLSLSNGTVTRGSVASNNGTDTDAMVCLLNFTSESKSVSFDSVNFKGIKAPNEFNLAVDVEGVYAPYSVNLKNCNVSGPMNFYQSEVVIKGGIYNSTEYFDGQFTSPGFYVRGNSHVEIQSAIFNVASGAPLASEADKTTLKIYGGTFTDINGNPLDISEYLANGLKLNENGEVIDSNVAQVGETKYETLPAAIEAAQDGDTVLLLEDVDAATVNKTVTIDLGGCTIKKMDVAGNGADNPGITATVYNGTVETADITNRGKILSNKIEMDTVNATNGRLETNGGTYGTVKVTAGGNIHINNGSFTTVNADGAGYASIKDGAFDTVTIKNTKTKSISGGTFDAFSEDLRSAVVAGKIVVKKDGKFAVMSMSQVVATADGWGYMALDDAINAVKNGGTVEILKGGVYSALTVPDGVTIKGAENVEVVFTGSFTKVGANVSFQNVTFKDANPLNYGIGDNLSVKNCSFIGDDSGITAMYIHTPNITVDNCTFQGYKRGYYTCGDNHAAGKITFTNNTFENVTIPFDGYWGKAATEETAFTITGNTFSDGSYVQLWDYTQYLNRGDDDRQGTALNNVSVTGNNGSYQLVLVHTDWRWETGRIDTDATVVKSHHVDIDKGDQADDIAAITVAWAGEGDMPGFERQTTEKNGGFYHLPEGDYVATVTYKNGKVATHDFTVGSQTVGETQTLDLKEYVAAIGGTKYESLEEAIKAAKTDEIVELLQDVTVDTWKQIWDVENVTINGNGKTLTVGKIESGVNGNFLLYRAQNLVVNDLNIVLNNGSAFDMTGGTLAGVTVTGGSFAVSGASNTTITNCAFTGQSDMAIYTDDTQGAPGLVVDGCTFTDTRVGILRANEQITNCTVSGPARWYQLTVVGANAVVSGNSFSGNDRALELYGQPANITRNNLENAGDILISNEIDAEFTEADLSANYWGGSYPTDIENAKIESYYDDAEMTHLVLIEKPGDDQGNQGNQGGQQPTNPGTTNAPQGGNAGPTIINRTVTLQPTAATADDQPAEAIADDATPLASNAQAESEDIEDDSTPMASFDQGQLESDQVGLIDWTVVALSIAGLAVLGGLFFLLARKRRKDEEEAA